MKKEIEEIITRSEAATPGPWLWDMNTHNKCIQLITDHSGKYFVMGFRRWGPQDAAPTFQLDGRMVRADELAKSYPGQEHHIGFDDYIDHPDALFIAHARKDIATLLEYINVLETQMKPEADWYITNYVSRRVYEPAEGGDYVPEIYKTDDTVHYSPLDSNSTPGKYNTKEEAERGLSVLYDQYRNAYENLIINGLDLGFVNKELKISSNGYLLSICGKLIGEEIIFAVEKNPEEGHHRSWEIEERERFSGDDAEYERLEPGERGYLETRYFGYS